jgi:hypothetical protein
MGSKSKGILSYVIQEKKIIFCQRCNKSLKTPYSSKPYFQHLLLILPSGPVKNQAVSTGFGFVYYAHEQKQ